MLVLEACNLFSWKSCLSGRCQKLTLYREGTNGSSSFPSISVCNLTTVYITGKFKTSLRFGVLFCCCFFFKQIIFYSQFFYNFQTDINRFTLNISTCSCNWNLEYSFMTRHSGYYFKVFPKREPFSWFSYFFPSLNRRWKTFWNVNSSCRI